ncbi:MAG: ABC transporter ATP-binding protein [Actinomycetota bacterium]
MNTMVVACEGLSKSFGSTKAVSSFGLEVYEGELIALLGPSGCGKTTVLRMIAGLERPDAGTIHVAGTVVSGGRTWVPPEGRRVGIVFQDWALFPHLTVAANVTFGATDPERVEELLTLLSIGDLGDRMPHELSGGQQQRVAIARALAPAPDVLLLDEPFSNLDAALRARVRAEVREVLRRAGVTSIFVTHDQEEALSIADRVAVMARGRLQQVGTAWDVYEEPASLDVAWMVGRANVLAAQIQDEHAKTPLGVLPAPGQPDGSAVAMIRPEALEARLDVAGPGLITACEFYGHDQLLRVRIDGGSTLEIYAPGSAPDLDAGRRVHIGLTGDVRYYTPGGTH